MNHLPSLPLPAAAILFTNAVSIAAWSSSLVPFNRYHLLRQRLLLRASPCGLPSPLRRTSSSCGCGLGFEVTTSSSVTSVFANAHKRCNRRQVRCYARSARHGYEQEHRVITSIRQSLWCDIVQPHLDTVPIGNDGKNTPPLVLVLAVSGGCDSIALFHAVLALTQTNQSNQKETQQTTRLLCLRSTNTTSKPSSDERFSVPCELHVAHFNHEQRGESSDRDEGFVKALCQENGIPIHCYSWSDRNITSANRKDDSSESFTQDVARTWRKQTLGRLLLDLVVTPNPYRGTDTSERWGAILTAHHRDDVDETILLKLLRGSHLTNLWGMDARSDGFDLLALHDNDTVSKSPASTFTGYFAKPMLSIRKNDVLDYLNSQSIEWREDESNNSNKYKRNKIRNEVMPLLKELAGGEDALQKRFSNLEEQSRAISQHLLNRAEKYLLDMPSNSVFHLTILDSTILFDLEREEALHLWLTRVTDNELQISYEQMKRIRHQLNEYPERLQWTIDVGNSWRVSRNGDILVVFNRHEDDNIQTTEKDNHIHWSVLRIENNDSSFSSSKQFTESEENAVELHFRSLPPMSDHSSLEIKRVNDIDGNATFLPPWRAGRSPIKVREFLRGQRVPLHCRGESLVLCYTAEPSIRVRVCAVFVENEHSVGKWIVHSDFCSDDASPKTMIILGMNN
eukprot:g3328.t1 g3328   contig12:1850449-1852653(+)